MEQFLPPAKVKVIYFNGKGRGVVATQKIKSGEIIEYCPIVPLSQEESEFVETKGHILMHYYLEQPEFKRCCMMLGYGCLYNHDAKNPNAEVDYPEDKPNDYLFFRAIKDIEPGEEIVYNYNFDEEEYFLKLD